MNFVKKLFLIKLFLFTSMVTHARGTKVEDVKFNSRAGDEIEFSIAMEKGFRGIPQLEVKKNILQVSIPKSYVWPKIEKQVTVDKKFDTKVIAYQFSKDLVRFRAILPNSLEGKKNLITLAMEGDNINLKIPKKLVSATTPVKRTKKAKRSKKAKQNVNKYDESYLEKLFQDKLASEQDFKAIPKLDAPQPKAKVVAEKTKPLTEPVVEDKVGFKESSLGDKESKFSVMTYIGKFVAFLALILVGFYFVVTLMKKGVLKKGKLGFLNSTKVVEVLNTTYIAPKRSISVIKAHNQVFLIGNSEKGIHYLSEINDVAGLMKNGELDIAGNNFDTNLNTESDTDKQFNLKEVLTESAPVVREKSSVKNQISAKLKNLKSLQ